VSVCRSLAPRAAFFIGECHLPTSLLVPTATLATPQKPSPASSPDPFTSPEPGALAASPGISAASWHPCQAAIHQGVRAQTCTTTKSPFVPHPGTTPTNHYASDRIGFVSQIRPLGRRSQGVLTSYRRCNHGNHYTLGSFFELFHARFPCTNLHNPARRRRHGLFRKSNKDKSVMRNWVRFVKDVRGSHSHLSLLPKICLRHTAMHPLPVDRRFWSSFLIVLRTCTGWFATGNGRVISRTSGSRTYTRSMPEKKDSRKKDWTEP